MPRITVDPTLRSGTHTISCYGREWDALTKLAEKLNLHTNFDVVRLLVNQCRHPAFSEARSNGSFNSPRIAVLRPKSRKAA